MKFTVSSDEHTQAIELTNRINTALDEFEDPPTGLNVWVPHTTAGITVNESADPKVMQDLISQLEVVVPWEGDYAHYEGNAAAHIKSVLLGSHQWLPVSGNQLNLGRWQGIFLLEWDGPRERTVEVYPD